jgi:chromosome partitioning protein
MSFTRETVLKDHVMATAGRKAIKPLTEAIIIAVFNQKGGCGKTQTSMQLGGTLALRGYPTLIVDVDPQNTATVWSGKADSKTPFPATVVSLSSQKNAMIGEVEKFSKQYSFIIIDCPPAIESTTPWAALNIANLGLIPIIPLLDNMWASEEAKALGKEAQQRNPDLLLRTVPTNVSRGNLYAECISMLREDEEIPMLETPMSHRNSYPESQIFGSTVHHAGARNKAVQEVEAFTTEILKLFNIKG